MTTEPTHRLMSLLALAVFVACGTESARLPSEGEPGIAALAFFPDQSPWSEPVNLGAPVNSARDEQSPTLSKDGLSLYFQSNRTDLPGALGANDIWVSRRACLDCPWETPVNLGPGINSSSNDGQPALSIDGHLLFFQSGRPGGRGGSDIYVSRRANPQDDFGWGPPVNLGPDVNTTAPELQPAYLQSSEDGTASLYFARGPITSQDIYYAPVSRNGETRGPAVLVDELSDPNSHEASPSVRADGREILFSCEASICVSTRRSVHDAWSSPQTLSAPVDAPGAETQPSLSFDGRTLLFIAFPDRGGAGFTDIWMSTRTPSGH